jgi:ABC1 atypical kinase-like domain
MGKNNSDEGRTPKIRRYQNRRYKDKDAAAVLVELLQPGAWIAPAHARWVPVIEALLEAFLRHFEPALLARLLDHQRALPPSASAAARVVRMAGELTALHKLCQMLARNPRLPAEARAALAPLESLPPEAIPDTAVSAAVALAVQARPDLELDYESRRDAARLVFRRLILDPLFSGLPESIFHADPHAGNLMMQTQKHAPLTLVPLDWSQAGRLSAPLRHALIALCLYCVTGDEPSPDVLMRLLESDRKSIRIMLPQGTGDPLHAAFETVQQLALQGYPVPLNLLLLRKSFLTLGGITRQLDPDFNAWLETLAYASGVFASEAVVRTWSIQFPWLDRPDFYRSGLPTRTLAAHFAGTIRSLCFANAKQILARF